MRLGLLNWIACRRCRARLQLREDKERGIFIDKARSIYVSSAEEMMEVIAAGAENRELSATGMNAGSSRCAILQSQ